MAGNYRNFNVITDSGQVLVLRPANAGDFRAEKLRLNTDPLRPGQVIEIDTKEVAEQRFVETSRQTNVFRDGFTSAEPGRSPHCQ